ncbi:MAG: helix-turn-helix domain-containing protein [Coriobacteriia bacterium]|nr:helix-turn-helix domain-containing protein [Coriobacteriia bacterium]
MIDQREKFIYEYMNGPGSFKSLCIRYGFSEKTGHKWKNRFMQSGMSGLLDLSKAPRRSPNRLDEDAVIGIIKIKEAHPSWGAKKIAVLFQKAYPRSNQPSISSINRVLDEADLVTRRKVRTADGGSSLTRNQIPANELNDVWATDFKGWWYLDKQKCLPFTERDLFSRNIL